MSATRARKRVARKGKKKTSRSKRAYKRVAPPGGAYAEEPGAGYAYASTVKTLAKAKGKPKRSTVPRTRAAYRECVATARDSGKSTGQRVAALRALTPAVCDDTKRLQSVLDILTSPAEPKEVRYAALQTLQAASFSVVKFAPRRASYLAALRTVATDEDLELRQRVLGILAREGDGKAQQLLLDGLKGTGKALVPPEKALQLLSYDVHSDAYPVARAILEKPPNDAARREALRLLAADATSAPVFEKILKNKKETPEIRKLSASALHAIAPQRLQSQARRILMDSREDDTVKAVSLTAITDLRPPEEGTVDDKLYKQVGRVQRRSSSALVKRSAKRFLNKYKR